MSWEQWFPSILSNSKVGPSFSWGLVIGARRRIFLRDSPVFGYVRLMFPGGLSSVMAVKVLVFGICGFFW